MKKFIPLAILASAAAAASVYLKNNKKVVDKTLDELDRLTESAEETIADLAEELNVDHSWIRKKSLRLFFIGIYAIITCMKRGKYETKTYWKIDTLCNN